METKTLRINASADIGGKQMLVKDAKEITGGLSNESKMPGKAWGRPAKYCKIGAKLHKVKGSVCEDCYALKHAYLWKGVQAAFERRHEAIANDPRWDKAMVTLIKNQDWFRWFGSGDCQSVEEFARIMKICELTPDTRHWIPTREYAIVTEFVESGGVIPDNVVVRLSAHMIDGKAPVALAKKLGINVSTVSSNGNHTCPAPKQKNECRDCRKCWAKEVFEVSYKKH